MLDSQKLDEAIGTGLAPDFRESAIKLLNHRQTSPASSGLSFYRSARGVGETADNRPCGRLSRCYGSGLRATSWGRFFWQSEAPATGGHRGFGFRLGGNL